MTGTLLNVAAVLAGSGVGLALGARLPERLRSMTQSAVGLTVVVIGLGLALRTENAVLMLASLLVGGLIGAWLDIEAAVSRLGARAQERFGASGQSNLVRGFLAASLLYCVGPMTILGSFQDGLSGDFSLLATKSALDGVSSVVLAATLGVGVVLSAATVLIYQGSLTLAAEALRPLLSEAMVRELSAVGGLIIVALGLGLLEVRQLRTANFLPALLVAPLATAFLERV